MSVNVELLNRTLDVIRTEVKNADETPDTSVAGQWDQEDYRCETGMCFAGWAAQLDGGQWSSGPGESGSAFMRAVEADGDPYRKGYIISKGLSLVHVSWRAERILGISGADADILFDGNNTLYDLEEMVAHLIEHGDLDDYER